MSTAPRCLECDALHGRAHDPECSFSERPQKVEVSTKWLIDQREAALIAYDNANPDVGPGIQMFGYSRKLAIKQLITEGALPEGFEETV